MRKEKLFNVIKNEKEYWLVDQIKQEKTTNDEYAAAFQKLLQAWKAENAVFISVLMDQELEERMMDSGFAKISTIVEYTRKLDNINDNTFEIDAHSLADDYMNDQEFALLYEKCSRASANKNKAQSKDELLRSLRQELGDNWRFNCFIFSYDQTVVGMAIPHIEMGTKDEGRLFYFGIVPEFRGKGFGKQMHRKTLALLKDMKATYYVGSTDEANAAMIEIFKQNDCELRDRKGIYRMERG